MMARDYVITLVDGLGRTVTTTRYPAAPRGTEPARLGRTYLQGWNERGERAYGTEFLSHADGFEVHTEDGRIVAYG